MRTNSFDKIEFPNNLPMEEKEKPRLPKMRFAKLRGPAIIAVLLIVVLALFSLFVGLKVKKIYAQGRVVATRAKSAVDAAKKQNVVLTKEELIKTKQELLILEKNTEELKFLTFFPIVNTYYEDAQRLITAADYGMSAAITSVDALLPYADVLGLKGEKSFVLGSAEERIKIAIKTMGKVVVKIDDIEKDLLRAKEQIDKIDPQRYPNISRLKKIRTQIEQLRVIADEGVAAISEAKPLIKVLPEVLGEPVSKRYLILFQNDKELRPTGGFMTFYSIFRIDQGVIHVEAASDIYDLDRSIPSHPPAPAVILKYLPKVSTLNIRDSNLSPDFVDSMKTFNSLYEKSRSPKVDGIISLDTHVLSDVLDILGEVNAAGVTFHSKKDERCDCPQVVYQLELFADKPVGHVIENRKAIIGELLFAIMDKALSSSPKLYWGRLFQQALKELQEKHILVYLYNNDAQKGIEALNWAGKVKEFEGDYLHVNDSNFAGAKSNMYVKQSVRVDYEVNEKSEITKKVTIDYKNPYPHSDCDLESGGLCLNATLRDYLRLYVPKGSSLQDVKGSEVKVETLEELGKTTFASFLTVKPEGKSQIVFRYALPFKAEKGVLPVMIQKQPGTDGVSYELYVNGKKQESFVLNEDKTLSLRLN